MPSGALVTPPPSPAFVGDGCARRSIYDASDHAYNGFLRAPLIRYEGYWSLTNSLLEHGVNVMAGTSWLQGEVTVGRSADVSDN